MLWREAAEVAEIGERLIAEHDVFEPLKRARIEWLFMDKAPVSNGRLVLGRARRVSGWPAWWDRGPIDWYDAPVPFFVVEITEPVWHELRPHQRVALVDHELSHLVVDESTDPVTLRVRGHDFEEFAGTLRRHGLWSGAASAIAHVVVGQIADEVDGVVSFVQGLPTRLNPDDGADGGDGGD